MTVEGPSTALLGAFGSSLARTHCLDNLAAEGISLDQCHVDSIDLLHQLKSLWTGRHAMQESADWPSIWQLCNEAELPSCVITDCADVAEFAESLGCVDAILISPPEVPSQPADDIASCSAMQLFLVASELLSERNGLVWIHSAGLRLPWDAPVELRNQYVDPEDPAPPSEVGPPWLENTQEVDPDLVVGWGQVATAQTSVIDEGLGALRAACSQREDRDSWTWVVSCIRGIPLGEHGQVGRDEASACDDAGACSIGLYGEELNSPTVIVPNQELLSENPPAISLRRAELFQLPDLSVTIAASILAEFPESWSQHSWGRDILSLEPSDSPKRWRSSFQLAAIKYELEGDQSELWIRAPAWSLRCQLDSATLDSEDQTVPAEQFDDVADALRNAQMYVKPEDRWEVNDVADRRSDIVQMLIEHGVEFLKAAKRGDRNWSELSPELISLLR